MFDPHGVPTLVALWCSKLIKYQNNFTLQVHWHRIAVSKLVSQTIINNIYLIPTGRPTLCCSNLIEYQNDSPMRQH